MKTELKTGDKVAYKRAFLKSCGMYFGNVPRAKGTITEITPFGQSSLALIAWDLPDVPERVNTANLCKVGSVDYID